jgi:hypothetical protein
VPFKYQSGEEIRAGDLVTYHGSPGRVVFVVSAPVGDRAMDWYLETFPGGGFMIETEGMGSVFLPASDEDLLLTSRGISAG